MSTAMADWQWKIIKRKHWLKRRKAVPKKRNLDQNINDSKSHNWNSFFFRKCYFGHTTFLYLSRRSSGHCQKFFFNFRFSSRKLESQQNLARKITHFAIQFQSKNHTHLWTSTHLTLKIICYCNTAKTLSDIKNFPADMFLFGDRKNVCTISWYPRTGFLKYFENKCMYISVYLHKKIFD